MSKKLLVILAPLVTVVALIAVPTAAQAVTPHWFTAAGKIAENGKTTPTISWGKLALTPVVTSPVATECENAVAGVIDNPTGGGPGQSITEAFTSWGCTNTECEAAKGHIGVIFENEVTPSGPGLRLQIDWPGELTNANAPEIRLKTTNVDVYVHCQFAYTEPTEKPGGGPFTGLEERNTAEYNGGTKVSCTTGKGGLQEPLTEENGPGTSKPGATNFETVNTHSSGALECGLFKGDTSKHLESLEYNPTTGIPAWFAAKEG